MATIINPKGLLLVDLNALTDPALITDGNLFKDVKIPVGYLPEGFEQVEAITINQLVDFYEKLYVLNEQIPPVTEADISIVYSIIDQSITVIAPAGAHVRTVEDMTLMLGEGNTNKYGRLKYFLNTSVMTYGSPMYTIISGLPSGATVQQTNVSQPSP